MSDKTMAGQAYLESACSVCGLEYVVEINASKSFRKDGKRVYRKGLDTGSDAFRCAKCMSVISKCVAGAEYGDSPNATGDGTVR